MYKHKSTSCIVIFLPWLSVNLNEVADRFTWKLIRIRGLILPGVLIKITTGSLTSAWENNPNLIHLKKSKLIKRLPSSSKKPNFN